jgi:hypothetical protein
MCCISFAQFDIAADQVVLATNRNVLNAFSTFGTLASVITSSAKKSGETFPYVTMDDFEVMAAGFRNTSLAFFIHYCPLVIGELASSWNDFSVANADWIEEGRRNQPPSVGGNVSSTFIPFLFQLGDNSMPVSVTGSPGPFCPAWLMSPVPDTVSLVNFDMFSDPLTLSSTKNTMTTGLPSLSLTAPDESVRMAFDIPADGPVSLLHVPVYDVAGVSSDKMVVGFLTGAIVWKAFLDNVLPRGQENILVVIESCNSVKNTFLINGPTATFWKDGDHHDCRFDSMAHTQNFVGIEEPDPNNSQCKHFVHVFPTRDLENEYLTKGPLLYTLILFLIFFIAGIVFIVYDYCVNARIISKQNHVSN